MEPNSLKIIELFHSIQGEGPSTGVNSAFLRVPNCNLRCVFCDTKRSWSKLQTREEINPDELAHYLMSRNIRNVVITGGEPLLQQDKLIPFIEQVNSKTMDFEYEITWEIETNGTINPKLELTTLIKYYNVSPKLSNSGMDWDKCIIADVMTRLSDLSYFSDKANFKFVIDTEKELDEVVFLAYLFGMPAKNIWIMPLGTTVDDTLSRVKQWKDRVLDLGFNISLRTHIILGVE